jgi:hypothetical protein
MAPQTWLLFVVGFMLTLVTLLYWAVKRSRDEDTRAAITDDEKGASEIARS